MFEKISKERISSYLDKINFFTKYQFGFRANRSTEHAIAALLLEIDDCLDDDFHVATVFYDIKKAFDTLNHEILLDKMINSGIRGKALQIIKSYLCGRKNHIRCRWKNDFPRGLNENINHAILFADDTAITVKARDSSTLIENLTISVTLVNRRFVSNNLVPNFTKTNFMVFGRSKRATREISCQELQIGDQKICRVQSYCYLGVFLDPLLSFSNHIMIIYYNKVSLNSFS